MSAAAMNMARSVSTNNDLGSMSNLYYPGKNAMHKSPTNNLQNSYKNTARKAHISAVIETNEDDEDAESSGFVYNPSTGVKESLNVLDIASNNAPDNARYSLN